jgi:hypothetical protein
MLGHQARKPWLRLGAVRFGNPWRGEVWHIDSWTPWSIEQDLKLSRIHIVGVCLFFFIGG